MKLGTRFSYQERVVLCDVNGNALIPDALLTQMIPDGGAIKIKILRGRIPQSKNEAASNFAVAKKKSPQEMRLIRSRNVRITRELERNIVIQDLTLNVHGQIWLSTGTLQLNRNQICMAFSELHYY